jgi:pimeloyl-ACP methyl ester carboxylesterase
LPLETIPLESGRRVSSRVDGAGPPLVQIHGIGTGHHNFDLLTPLLASSFRVVDVDLPGYGESDPIPEPRSIGAFATAVAEWLDVLQLGPVHVHGTSMGGLVAMALAAARPELVDRLVVTCSFGRLDNAMRAMQGSWRTAAACGPAALAEVTSVQGFSRGFWDRPDAGEIKAAFVAALESSSTDDFTRDLELMAGADLSDDARRIEAATLLLGAAEDQMTPLQTAPSGLGMTDLAVLIPRARLQVLAGCGHFISIERGQETATAIADFLLASSLEEVSALGPDRAARDG